MWEQTLSGVICFVCLNSIGWNYITHMHVLHIIYIYINILAYIYISANWPYIPKLVLSTGVARVQIPFLWDQRSPSTVPPANLPAEGNFLFESCDCGVKSSGTKGGSDKKVFDMYQKCLNGCGVLEAQKKI